MNNLTIASLALLFICCGSGVSFLSLVAMLLGGYASLNYMTLLCACTMLTYCFYSFLGLVYVFAAAMVLLTCGCMFWYDLSMDDMMTSYYDLKDKYAKEQSKQKHSISITDLDELDELDEDVITTDNTQNNDNIVSERDNLQLLKDNLQLMKEYSKTQMNVLCVKLHITDGKIQRVKHYCVIFSNGFDKMCD